MDPIALVVVYLISATLFVGLAFWLDHQKEKRILVAIKESEDNMVKKVREALQAEEITVNIKTMPEKVPGSIV